MHPKCKFEHGVPNVDVTRRLAGHPADSTVAPYRKMRWVRTDGRSSEMRTRQPGEVRRVSATQRT